MNVELEAMQVNGEKNLLVHLKIVFIQSTNGIY